MSARVRQAAASACVLPSASGAGERWVPVMWDEETARQEASRELGETGVDVTDPEVLRGAFLRDLRMLVRAGVWTVVAVPLLGAAGLGVAAAFAVPPRGLLEWAPLVGLVVLAVVTPWRAVRWWVKWRRKAYLVRGVGMRVILAAESDEHHQVVLVRRWMTFGHLPPPLSSTADWRQPQPWQGISREASR